MSILTADRLATKSQRNFLVSDSTLFGTTILLSAFLLFLSEPLISKLILPWFGGSSAVWAMCLLFFQANLLAGYFYAHVLTRYLRSKRQVAVHCSLLFVSLLWLPLLPSMRWIPKPGEDPSWLVLGVLAGCIGLPYALLSATSPLLQNWFAGTGDSVLPYRYFALSNTGSLLALLSFPLLIEPYQTTHQQANMWSAAYLGFVLLCSSTAAFVFRSSTRLPAAHTDYLARFVPTSWSRKLLWLALAAFPSALLLSVTNLLTENIAPIPLLWVLPLSIYLLTFILCFESNRWYRRLPLLALVIPALGCLAGAAGPLREGPIKVVISLLLVSLFVCCMACHGELARLKPGPAELTTFYLVLAAGGVFGGLAVALIAPHLFPAMYEYPIEFVGCGALLLVVTWTERERWPKQHAAWSAWLAGAAALLVLAAYAALNTWHDVRFSELLARNFYGALRVEDLRDVLGRKVRQLNHGTITHGVQYQATALRGRPTTYYGLNSGIGLTWRILEASGPLRMGVIGLGAGTLASYGRGGDSLSFYEINPLVVQIAKQKFTFLADCPAHLEIVLGDARLTLSQQPDQRFDVMVVDAFSGDSIPIHLLTVEAFRIYFRHLKPGGVLAVHVSNRYLDLAPIVALAARAGNRAFSQADNEDNEGQEIFGASYVLVTNRGNFFNDARFRGHLHPIVIPEKARAWTDDYSNLFQVLKLRSEEW